MMFQKGNFKENNSVSKNTFFIFWNLIVIKDKKLLKKIKIHYLLVLLTNV